MRPGQWPDRREAECVSDPATDIAGLVRFCHRERIDFVVSAPRSAARLGSRRAEADGVPALAECGAAALEGRRPMPRTCAGAPASRPAATDSSADPARAKALHRKPWAPIVIKADGLGCGKGVTVATRSTRLFRAVRCGLSRFERRFEPLGSKIVVEISRGRGGELLCAGRRKTAAAGDRHDTRPRRWRCRAEHRRDGACSPTRAITRALGRWVMERIISLPTDVAQSSRTKPRVSWLSRT